MTAPVVDGDSRPWWDGLRGHRVVLQACQACRRRRFPMMPACPWCGAEGHDEVEVEGTGTVYSWVVVHRALSDDMRDEVPYTVAVVDLGDGVRMLGRLEGVPGDGVAVAPVFVDHDDWTELRFRTVP